MPKNSQPNFNWKIAGEAGHGVMLASKLMAKAAKRHGMQSFNYLEYPSLIRGGHQTGQVYADFDNASCQHRTLDMIVIFTQEGFDIHQDEMDEDTVIIYNSDFGQLKDEYVEEWGDQVYELPISTWAKETAGKALAANVVSLGASAYVLGMDLDVFKEIIADEFAAKPKLIDKNKEALDKGYEGAAEKMEPLMELDQRKDDRILLNGNEAIGMGAIAAGCQFYSAYPMTPATGLLHFMNEHKHKYPMVVKQVEDEIGAIHEAIGAAVAGVRAATGTSGGGFALMVEGLSFAGTAEVPLVILEAQRTGPASGVPTWTAQADLQFVLTAGHGDFPKVVLTPGTVEEHFELGKKAFYLAEKYQLPVILLSDKYILESHQTMPTPDAVHENERQSMVTDESDLPEDGSYLRYQDTEDGISQRSIPGQEHGTHLANSYEHDEWGFATEEAEVINQAVEKRSRKMESIMDELPQPQLIGPETADVTLVGWGSTVNVLLETINQAPDGSVNAIHIPCIKPLPTKEFTKLADKAKKLVMVEGNENGQAEDWIRQETGIEMDDSLHRYDGRPFYAEDLVEYVTR
jgi:2-oxoglutarate ferredoxin oxidoreductase subunit alpha